MIEQFPAKPLQGSRREDPLVMTSERAVLECGCSGFVGIRLDTMEPVTVLRACKTGHERIVQAAQQALLESLKTPSGRPMVEVVDALLVAAGRGHVK